MTEVHESLIKATRLAGRIDAIILALVSLYSAGMTFSVKWLRDGSLYRGSSVFTEWQNPGFSTTEIGRRSFATKAATDCVIFVDFSELGGKVELISAIVFLCWVHGSSSMTRRELLWMETANVVSQICGIPMVFDF